jgi:tetratricopeptide (TPR) repeat protein/predicted Ser/Thr protein kinase
MQAGDRVGRYTLLHPLGRGGMGEVWKARDESLDRVVAVKLLSNRDDEDVARFRREAQLAARLAHPNIAAIYEADDPFIAMQLIDGSALDRAGLSERAAAAAVRDAARAVAYAHAHGIVHRDLKPGNIMITKDGHVFVMDFGLARPLKTDHSLTASGLLLGTPSFMPPEQARAEPVDARSDVYALGATLYALLCGRPPFVGGDIVTLLNRVCNDDPIAPRRLNPGAGRDIEVITLRALHKDPARRYASAGDLADDLDRLLNGEPIAARPPSMAERVARHVRRRPLRYTLAALAAATVAAVPVVVSAQRAAAARTHVTEVERILASRARVEDLIRADAHARFADRPDLRARINRALGDLALESGDYGLARLAYSVCLTPEEADARISERRDAEARRRAARVKEILDDLRAGLGRPLRRPGAPLLDDHVFECVQYNDEQTVALLSEALAPFANRDGRWTQEERDVMTFCFRVLGRSQRESAVPPLAALMARLTDEPLVIECGLALCLTRSVAANEPLEAARSRLGMSSSAWVQIARLLPRIPAAAGSATNVEDLMNRGLARTQKGDFDGAIEDYTRAIALDGKSATAFNNRGNARLCKRDVDGAIDDFTRAVEVAPRHSAAWDNRGRARFAKGDFEGALRDHTRAFEISPTSVSAVNNRGVAKRRLGDTTGAIEDFSKALSIDARYAIAYVNRALSRRDQGDLDAALADEQRAVELDPTQAEAHNARGHVYNDRHEYDRALADFSRAIDLDPKLASAYHNRGVVHRMRGDLDGAIADFSRAVALDATAANSFNNRGLARRDKGDLDGALEDYRRALAADPKFAVALVNIAYVLRDKRDIPGANAEADRAIALDARCAHAYNLRGLLRKDRDVPAAIADFTRAIELDPRLAGAYYNRGTLRRGTGERDAAWEDLARAVALDPGNADAFNTRGLLLAEKGDLQGAVREYSQSLHLNPRFTAALINRGTVRKELKDADGAIADLTRAIELKALHPMAFLSRAAAYRLKLQYREAIADWERFLELAPSDPRVPDVRKAIADARAALEKKP